MLYTQHQFNDELNVLNTAVKILLIHAYNMLCSLTPHHGLDPEAANFMIEAMGYKKLADANPVRVWTLQAHWKARNGC